MWFDYFICSGAQCVYICGLLFDLIGCPVFNVVLYTLCVCVRAHTSGLWQIAVYDEPYYCSWVILQFMMSHITFYDEPYYSLWWAKLQFMMSHITVYNEPYYSRTSAISGPKQQRKFQRLMLHRIKWAESQKRSKDKGNQITLARGCRGEIKVAR